MRQSAVRFIKIYKQYVEENGRPPTYQEVGDILGVTRQATHDTAMYLVRHNLAKRRYGGTRALELLI
jgi:hypothetical protein